MALQNPIQLQPLPIQEIAARWGDCQRCPLYKGIFNYVYYRGSCPCEVLFIGEAPGKEEDKTGLAFVGRSGDLLEYIVEQTGIEFSYGIMNVLACIPPEVNKVTGKIGVRKPTPEEAEACRPRFLETLYAANPSLIVLLGATAKKFIKIPKDLSHIPVLELYHPAYMLRKGGRRSLDCIRSILYLRETLEEIYGEEVQNN